MEKADMEKNIKKNKEKIFGYHSQLETRMEQKAEIMRKKSADAANAIYKKKNDFGNFIAEHILLECKDIIDSPGELNYAFYVYIAYEHGSEICKIWTQYPGEKEHCNKDEYECKSVTEFNMLMSVLKDDYKFIVGTKIEKTGLISKKITYICSIKISEDPWLSWADAGDILHLRKASKAKLSTN